MVALFIGYVKCSLCLRRLRGWIVNSPGQHLVLSRRVKSFIHGHVQCSSDLAEIPEPCQSKLYQAT